MTPIRYYSTNYFEERAAFQQLAERNPRFHLRDRLSIGAANRDLSIDIAWLGSATPKKVLIHISGTHGVEGHAGSAIQRSLLERIVDFDDETAVIFVHALNPYGMAYGRRVNGENVDLNRNCTDQRVTHPIYAKVNELINPPKPHVIDFFHVRLLVKLAECGFNQLKAAVALGQYEFPAGLFYGGAALQEEPSKLFNWFEGKFSEETHFMIVDVHTGLGPSGKDTLLTPGTPSRSLREYFKISAEEQNANVGYSVSGLVTEALGDRINRITNCGQERIAMIGQEFGTVSMYQVLMALRDENAATHVDPSIGADAPERQALIRSFYLQDPAWLKEVIDRGRNLVSRSLSYLNEH